MLWKATMDGKWRLPRVQSIPVPYFALMSHGPSARSPSISVLSFPLESRRFQPHRRVKGDACVWVITEAALFGLTIVPDMISLAVMQFITQPFAEVRLGGFLLDHLADPQWTVFRAAIAFVKRSGTRHIHQPLRNFSNRAQVKLSVGVDLYGTSREGLSDLLEATTPNGQIFIYRNNGPYTFHPKVYLFKSARRADIVVGSGNLTGGGLFTNYEASLAVWLDLTLHPDAEFLQTIEGALDLWSQPQQGVCYGLTSEFLNQLVATGLVPSEAQLAAIQQAHAPATPPQATPATTDAAEERAPVPLLD